MEILNKITKKEATVQEKLTYLLPAIISLLYLIDIIFIVLIGKGLFRRLIPEFLNISKIIFIFSSIYAAYKNYDYFKKVTATSLLFVIICFFWIYVSLYPLTIRSLGGIFLSVITLIQIYLFLNLYLDKKFNILNLGQFSSLSNLKFSKKEFNLNLLKNKFVIGALILFGAFIFYNIFSDDNYDKHNLPLPASVRDNYADSIYYSNSIIQQGVGFNKLCGFSNTFEYNIYDEENLRIIAKKAVDRASVCYRSLPSANQQGGIKTQMLRALELYESGFRNSKKYGHK